MNVGRSGRLAAGHHRIARRYGMNVVQHVDRQVAAICGDRLTVQMIAFTLSNVDLAHFVDLIGWTAVCGVRRVDFALWIPPIAICGPGMGLTGRTPDGHWCVLMRSTR